MHRLIGARNLYPSTFHNISVPSSITVRGSGSPDIKCSFCRSILLGQNNIESMILIRHQSTRTARVLQKTSKKRSKFKEYKKYGELLQVSDNTMTELKVSINKLRAAQLSKLASSSLSLGQLHQLTNKSSKKNQKNQDTISEVDTELLASVKDKILKNNSTSKIREINLEDDKCALIFTRHTISNITDRLKTKHSIDMIKESYNNFRKATLYDQKLNNLRFAINEGLYQEFTPPISRNVDSENNTMSQPKGAHAVFRELFVDHMLIDNYDQEFMTHISRMQTRGMPCPTLEEMYDEQISQSEIVESREDVDFDQGETENIRNLKMKTMKQKIAKKNALKKKRRAEKENSMKTDMNELEKQGKQEALHKLLLAHLQLLNSLDMLNESQQILQYYRSQSKKSTNHVKVTDVRIYNMVLHGFGGKGNYDEAQCLLRQMEEDQIHFNAQTYAAVFECIERSGAGNKIDLLKKHLNSMTNKGITLNDLMAKTKFVKDQRDVVLKAIRRLDPSFDPQYIQPDLDYVCPLLENLKLDSDPKYREGLKEPHIKGLLTLEELKQRAIKQFDIEVKGEIEVTNIDVKDETLNSLKFYRKKLQDTENEWKEVIQKAFIRNLSTLKSQSYASHYAITLYPYLKVLEVDQFVQIIMGEIRKLVDGSETYSPTLKLLQRDLGLQVYQKYKIEQYRENGIMEKIEKLYDKYCEWYHDRKSIDGGDRAYNPRQVWQILAHLNREGASLDIEEAPWPMEIRQNIGKFLYNIIINDVKINVNMFKTKAAKLKKMPAVYKVHRPWGRLVRLEIKPHPVLVKLWHGAAWPGLRMRAHLTPMISPPAPWVNTTSGAYLITSTPLLRLPFYVVQQMKLLETAPLATLYPLLDSLNQLGEVPWVINQPILDLQLQVFRSGGSHQLDIPQPPTALDTSQFEVGDTNNKASAFRRRLAINRARAEMYSLWCDALYKLSLANHYRNDIFWLPHNMDFRGRVYACSPHLSQLGADSARALMLFAKKRKLGKDGLKWLKLHAINLTGTMKKSTLDERLAYADSIMDKIFDSADRPLDGEQWWVQSEEPWQTLACCKEIANAIRSGNPEEYPCAFPVHQDGSCNGLQHYAALGGDEGGAAAVNLAPLDRPQDVYAAIAALVEERRARDAENGVLVARTLESFVKRKVIKQTVMTTVYGVTRFGARLQIAKQLKDIDEFPKNQVWACSNYLTMKTFESIGEMFTSTKLIQDWFTDCAKVISGVCGESVEWVTPLGLPIVQPYYRRGAPSAAMPSAHNAPLDYQQRPCTVKQRNAFPPNFIHSLDSTHMMLTGLVCAARGLVFVSVHDCFWTHPDTVDVMNKICREQFVALHSRPLLDELSDFLVQRYSYSNKEIDESKNSAAKKRLNSLLRQVPSKGNFKLESVLDSVYFFS